MTNASGTKAPLDSSEADCATCGTVHLQPLRDHQRVPHRHKRYVLEPELFAHAHLRCLVRPFDLNEGAEIRQLIQLDHAITKTQRIAQLFIRQYRRVVYEYSHLNSRY